jgi:hypothetical protein
MDPEKYKSGRELFNEIKDESLLGDASKENILYAALLKIAIDIREILIDEFTKDK